MDKKLKNAADKIRMPEDMKQRIISAAELAEKNHVNTDNDGYIDVVSFAERVDPRRNIVRTIIAIAACAVLVGGIGTTGFLLHRQNSTQMSGSEVSGTECRSCPFGDFSEFDYRFEAGDGKNGRYSAETYAKLSDFLNKFNWGEELTEYETRTEEQDAKVYHIKWTRGDTPPVDCDIYISVDGFVTYQESMMGFESGAMETIGSKCYKIDLDAFDRGVQEILAQADAPTPFGDFSEFEYSLDAQDGKFGEYSAETYAKLSDFLNKFNWGVELGMSEAENDDETGLQDLFYEKYTITWTKGDTPPVNCNIYVSKTGYVLYNEDIEYLETDEDHFIESRSYRIDFNAFDRGITDILTGKSDTAVSDTLTGEDDSITTELGEKCETEGWEYLIKNVDVTKSGEGMTPFPEGHYSCNENGDLTCDSSYIIADMELTNKSSDDRSLYINSTRIDLYNYNAEELDFKTSMEATAYTFNGERSIYAGDFFKTDFKAGETKTFRVGYVIDDEYLDKNYDIIRIEINHSGMAASDKNIRYYNLGEDTNLNVIAQKQAKPNTEAFEYAELLFGQHERLTPTDEEGMAKFEDFVRNDFIKMLEPTSSDDIVRGVTYSILTSYRLDDNKRRQANYFIFTDGFVECNEYKTDEKGEMQLTNTEKYKIDVDKLESVLKDEIGVELPEYREININKVD